jgi:hypothetical protein
LNYFFHKLIRRTRSIFAQLTLEFKRRTTNRRLQVMSVMKHHITSKDVLILQPLGWQDQPQSNTPSIKRSLGGRLQRFGAIRSSETGLLGPGDGRRKTATNCLLITLD